MSVPARQHPLRATLAGEIHARPSAPLAVPVAISRLAMFGATDRAAQAAHLAALCRLHGVAVPDPAATYVFADFGTFRPALGTAHGIHRPYLLRPLPEAEDPFARPALCHRPVRLACRPARGGDRRLPHRPAARRRRPRPLLPRLPVAAESLSGSAVAGGAARVWTDFRVHADGFTRILLGIGDLPPGQTGRLAQVLWEIETYRMLALLALPPARAIAPDLAEASARLDQLAERVSAIEGLGAERAALEELSGLAAQIERAAAATFDRFSAARAYHGLVLRRLEELEEAPPPALPTLSNFLSRRLGPALATVDATGARIEALSARCARAVDLLRTRVALAQEAKSEELLSALAETGRSQLRLQQTVEGLSVAAISYYVLSILGYAVKPWAAAGLGLSAETLLSLLVPPVAAGVWLLLRYRRQVHG